MRSKCTSRLRPILLVACAGAAGPAVTATGQNCPSEWVSPPTGVYGSGQYGVSGINAAALASTTWFSPNGQQLVIAGNFPTLGGSSAGSFNNIGAWDGSRWFNMQQGMPGGFVFAVCEYNSQLIAGGNFGAAGPTSVSNIARWNGTSWSPLGSGTVGSVFALTVYNGQLYAGGDFISAGGAANTTRLARWNGSAWSGALASGGGANDTVASLAVYNGELVAGGNFTSMYGLSASRIAKFNGTSWSTLGTGANGRVLALTTRQGDNSLYAGGQFTTIGGVNTGTFARWDGSWHANGGVFTGQVNALSDYYDTTRFAEEVVVGGSFTAPNGATNLVQYEPAGGYTTLGVTGANGPINSLTQYRSSVIAGGSFTSASGVSVQNVAAWSGDATGSGGTAGWSELKPGLTGPVNCLLASTAGVYAGGNLYCEIGPTSDPALNVVFATGSSYSSETSIGGGGGPPAGVSGPVYGMGYFTHGSIILQRTDLIVGGSFVQAAGLSASNIAQFSGPGGWGPLGTGTNGQVNAIQQYGFGTAAGAAKIAATGQFTSAGGATNTNFVASWNGSWSALGTGFNGAGRCLTLYNNELIAGGDFSLAGGVPVRNIAKWNGSVWVDLPGLNTSGSGSVYALQVFNGSLVAGGYFAPVSSGQWKAAARWNGTTWASMDAGLPDNTVITAMCVHNNVLYAATGTVILRDASSTQLYRWNGLSWVSVLPSPYNSANGSGFPGVINALASANGSLWAGGELGVASGHSAPFLTRIPAQCYANCDCSDTSPVLNVGDFTCFLQKFAAGDPYANCDGSTTDPVLNVGDFTCFLQKFAAGCP